jgi:hypothetical protein
MFSPIGVDGLDGVDECRVYDIIVDGVDGVDRVDGVYEFGILDLGFSFCTFQHLIM